MKKHIIVGAVLAATLSFAAQAKAQIVSVDLDTTYQRSLYYTTTVNGAPVTFNYTAGVTNAENGGNYGVTFWNANQAPGGDRAGTDSPLQGGNQYGLPSLVDSTNTASNVSYSLGYDWADGTSGNAFPSSQTPQFNGTAAGYATSGNANGYLVDSGVSPSSGPLTLNLAGLSTTDAYTVIAYMQTIYFQGPSSVQVTLGGETEYYTPSNSLTTWVGGASTLAGAQAIGGSNYVEFDNLTSTDGTLQMVATGTGGQPLIMGFQVIDTGAPVVPEPSTYVLVGLGFCALVVLRRRTVKA